MKTVIIEAASLFFGGIPMSIRTLEETFLGSGPEQAPYPAAIFPVCQTDRLPQGLSLYSGKGKKSLDLLYIKRKGLRL